MSTATFRILRSATIGALLAAAMYWGWPIVAGLMAVLFVLSL